MQDQVGILHISAGSPVQGDLANGRETGWRTPMGMEEVTRHVCVCACVCMLLCTCSGKG